MSGISKYCRITNKSLHVNGDTVFQYKEGDFEQFLNHAYDFLNLDYPKFYKMDRLCKAGLLGSEIILDKPTGQNYISENTAVVLSNQASSLDTDVRFQKTMEMAPSPSLFVYTLPNIVIGEISIRHGLRGENAFFVFPNFNPEFLVNYTEDLLANHEMEAAIGGWIDIEQERHDVFLYLVEKRGSEKTIPHTTENLFKLYRLSHG